jgi:S-DNA-T family DNA segregation ATPase FtsK/SpoIIIE
MLALRQYLEAQADRVEALLAAHKMPARVIGGTAGPQVIRFRVQPAPHIRFSAIKRLADDLAIALRVANVRVGRGAEGIILSFPHPDPQPVTLAGLLRESAPLPVATAVLGLSENNLPLLARLASPEVAHILIAGTTGCGKSVLLRTIAASLILSNAPSAVGLVAVDPKARAFPRGFRCPHLMRPVITEPAQAEDVMRDLVHLMEQRDRGGECLPRVVVLIDELADLVMSVEGVIGQLERLAQRGREAGIHLVAATQRPSAAILSGIVRANFPLRLVGKVVSATDACIAAGRGGTDAERLAGRGDFLAVLPDTEVRFQAAYIAEADLRREATDSGAPVHSLPVAEVLEAPEDAWEPGSAPPQADDLDVLVRRLRPWWKQHGGEWGSKTRAVKFLFGEDAQPGGYSWQMTQAAIERLEAKTSSS